MSNSRLIELAKEGNAPAIAQLINQQLERRGVTAIASRQSSCLRLLLEAEAEPKQSVVLPYLQKALTRLASPAIQQVEVYGRKQGTASGWQSLLTLAQGEFEVFSGGGERRSIETETIQRAEGVTPGPPALAQGLLLQSQNQSQHRSQNSSRNRSGPQTSVETQTRIRPRTQTLTQSRIQPPSSNPARSNPSPSRRALNIWLQWQGAAWFSTCVTSLIATLGFGLVFLLIFSVFNRLSEAGVLLLVVIGLAVVFPLLGLLLGDAQTRVLRRWIGSIGSWRWLTMLGFMLGFMLTLCTHFLFSSQVEPLVPNPTQGFVIGRGIPFVATTIGLLLSLLCVALVQWLILRGTVPRAYEWILANVFGGMLSWGAGMMASDRWIAPLVTSNSSYDFWSKLMVIGAGGFLSWFLFHALSGLSMARLLTPLPLFPDEK